MAKRASQTPTVYSIARACGVSPTTVSLALKNSPKIRPQTVEHIQAYARKVGYRPNQMARNLKRSASGVLGLVFPSPAHLVDASLLDVFYRHAHEHGYEIQIHLTYDDLHQEARALNRCLDSRVEGIFLVGCFEDVSELPKEHPLQTILASHTPLVVMGKGPDKAVRIRRDRATVVTLATEHLRSQQYDRICLLMANRSPESDSHVTREQAYRNAMGKHFSPHDIYFRTSLFEKIHDRVRGNDHLYFNYQAHHRYGYEMARDAIAETDAGQTLGLICSSDVMAAGAMQYCREQALEIPAHVGIVGCDDTVSLSMDITSFKWDHYQLCATVIDELLAQIKSKTVKPMLHKAKPTLVVRRSTMRFPMQSNGETRHATSATDGGAE